jgi:hypothetical protein
VSLSADGTLSGTPTPRDDTEVYGFTVRVRSSSDGKRARAVRSLTMTVLPST